jgi:hypothetical protein
LVEPRAFDDIAVFTDGLERLALQFDTGSAHAPFFDSMFRPLNVAPSGYRPELETSLVDFLNSEKVTNRTDDDKTIVIASRRALFATSQQVGINEP